MNNELTQSQQDLVMEHTEYAMKFANRFISKGKAYWEHEADDVEGVCLLALCKAAKTYDPEAGAEFTSWLWGYMQSELRDHNFTLISVPAWKRYTEDDSHGSYSDYTELEIEGGEDNTEHSDNRDAVGAISRWAADRIKEAGISDTQRRLRIMGYTALQGRKQGKTFREIAKEEGGSVDAWEEAFQRICSDVRSHFGEIFNG